MSHKCMLYVGLLYGVLCCACSSPTMTIVRDSNYMQNAQVLGPLSKGVQNSNKTGVEDGEYNKYFARTPIQKKFPYQLVYHHPKDFSADTNSYYIALVDVSLMKSVQKVSAFYNGQPLPTAMKKTHVPLLGDEYNVNIFLSLEQLIEAYEGPGKLIIFLDIDGETYDVVFPDFYLLNVLATTTNISKYKEDKLLNTAVPTETGHPTRNLLSYRTTLSAPVYSTPIVETGIQRVTFDWDIKEVYPPLSFTVTYSIQRFTMYNSESYYVKDIYLQEKAGSNANCERLKASSDNIKVGSTKLNAVELTVQCVKNGVSHSYGVELYETPKKTWNCATCKLK